MSSACIEQKRARLTNYSQVCEVPFACQVPRRLNVLLNGKNGCPPCASLLMKMNEPIRLGGNHDCHNLRGLYSGALYLMGDDHHPVEIQATGSRFFFWGFNGPRLATRTFWVACRCFVFGLLPFPISSLFPSELCVPTKGDTTLENPIMKHAHTHTLELQMENANLSSTTDESRVQPKSFEYDESRLARH